MKGNRNFNMQADFFRLVSRQRAYNLTFVNRIRNLTAANTYPQFFQAAEPPSFRFMQNQAIHEGVQCQRHVYQTNQIANPLAAAIGNGNVCLLGFFGVYNGINWGHATGVGWRNIAGSRPRFFDPNQGQYSLPSTSTANQIAQGVIANINAFYHLNTIRNFIIYRLN